MEGVYFLLLMAAVLEITHIWKHFKRPILPWIAFCLVIIGFFRGFLQGMSLDHLLICLLIYSLIKLIPYWSKGYEL